jgi:threonyl-tRNA synthetase
MANMIQITLKDNSIKSFDGPVTGHDVATSIGTNLAKAAVAIKVNGVLLDLVTSIEENSSIEIVTISKYAGNHRAFYRKWLLL